MRRNADMNLPYALDRYPSRVSDVPSVIRRRNPVVYGTPESGPLDLERLDYFEKNGYLFFDSLFTRAEAAALLEEVERLRRLRAELNPDYVIEEPGGGAIRSFFSVHEFSPAFTTLAKSPKIVRMAEQILGGQVYIHQSRVNLKPGFRGKDFYWHSDFETWHVEDGMPAMRALSCTVNLTENDEYNGPLMVIPGSHHAFVACVGKTPENHHAQSLRKQEYGLPDEETVAEMAQENGVVSFKGPPGSVGLFDCNILHGSNSNITPWPRSNAFLVYNSVHNKLCRPYCGLPSRPEHIAARTCCEPA
jgi:ectoine hydroxylase